MLTRRIVPTVNYSLKQVFERQFRILGFSCDLQAKQQDQSTGSRYGPKFVRPFLKQHHLKLDYSIDCLENLDFAQHRLEQNISATLRIHGKRSLVIGGGRETSYGNFLGVYNTLLKSRRIGIIALDRQFKKAKFQKHFQNEYRPFNFIQLQSTTCFDLQDFLRKQDATYLTISMEEFDKSYELDMLTQKKISIIKNSGTFIAADIVEYNPLLDDMDMTGAQLVSKLAFEITHSI